MSDSSPPHGLKPARLLWPWNFPGKNTRVDCRFLLQGIFPTQRLNLSLLSLALAGRFFTTAPPGEANGKSPDFSSLLTRAPALLDRGPTLIQYDLILINYICKDPNAFGFTTQIRSYSEILGGHEL